MGKILNFPPINGNNKTIDGNNSNREKSSETAQVVQNSKKQDASILLMLSIYADRLKELFESKQKRDITKSAFGKKVTNIILIYEEKISLLDTSVYEGCDEKYKIGLYHQFLKSFEGRVNTILCEEFSGSQYSKNRFRRHCMREFGDTNYKLISGKK